MFVLKTLLSDRPTDEIWDHVSGLLYEFHSLGIEELSVPEPDTSVDFEPSLEEGVLSPPQEFLAYFDNVRDANRAQRAIESTLLHLKPQYEISEVEKKDYSEIWKENFKPLHCKPNWLVRASWHVEPLKKNQRELIIEPGMAFGTGSHDTTKGCLELLTHVITKNKIKTCLDFGCGSGILAIAAKLLGVPHVVATDIDPLSIDATKQNAQRNNVQVEATIQPSDYKNLDLIIANILKNTLIEYASSFNDWNKKNGHLILSGLLMDQRDTILAVYKKNYELKKEVISKSASQQDRWVSLLLQKKN